MITNEDDLARGAAALAALAPEWGPVLERLGPLPLRLRGQGFTPLFQIIVGQQVSTASAAAIWARLEAAGLVGEQAVAKADEATLTACGLSRPKARYASRIARQGVEWAGFQALDDDAAHAALCALPGVGPWTAEVYLLQGLGRPDVMPAGDVALQEAARRAFGLAVRPSAEELARMALRWQPWRAVAARALWAYYRIDKGREGI